MTDVAVDTLRLRGPQARRLAVVAARALPAALERALADVGDIQLDRVTVSLDLDVADYDDETLAVLWADTIRARLLATRRRTSPDAAPREPAAGRPPVPGPPGPGRPGHGHAPAEVLATLRGLDPAAGGPGGPVTGAVLALADPGTARAVADAAGPREWAALLASLARKLRLAEPGRRPGHDRAMPEQPAEPAPPAAPAAGDQGREPADPTEPAGMDARERAVVHALAELADLVDEPPSARGPLALTRVAGLALVYPWLADHCRRAEALHPGLDGLDVREAALAAIIDPDDLALADDPLIGLLAGRPGPAGAPAPGRARLALPGHAEVAGSGVGVLASFAALLPGFERSSPAFVRDAWIGRLGLVDDDRDPVLLTAATHPLDVVLPRLPYPIGLIKLPWSPPLTVRFRP
jgi:hypothetical protein